MGQRDKILNLSFQLDHAARRIEMLDARAARRNSRLWLAIHAVFALILALALF